MTSPSSALRCLWLARALPFPLDSGDRIYTARLAGSLADAGCHVHFTGLATGPVTRLPLRPNLVWDPIAGSNLPTWKGLLSAQPLNGAIHATPAYRQHLSELLSRKWDMVVLDHYGMAWALAEVQRHRHWQTQPPVVVHVAHNHETTLWRDMVRLFKGPPWRRLALWQNLRKIERVERQLATGVDLLCCIAAEDAQAFAQHQGAEHALVLTPGFSGLQMPDRTLQPDTPRRVVMVGSFRWVVKQENLKALAQEADRVFLEHRIALDVVGDVPEALRAELAGCASVTLHGFVDDIAPLLRGARLALVPELIGGGFKLKFLDYVFGRMPVVTLDAAAAGLPDAVRAAMLRCPDLPALVQAVVSHIDDLPLLDSLQREAHAAAAPLFDWRDRGTALRDAVLEVAHQRQRARVPTRPAPRAWA